MVAAWVLLEEECDFDNYENDCWYKDVLEAHQEYLEQE